MEKPKRSNEKYWTGTNQFDEIQYANDLEEYITELEVKKADFPVSELMIKINEIIKKYPAQGNYAEDGRYTYPDRWNALLKYIKEKELRKEK